MNLDLKDIPAKLNQLSNRLKKYNVFIAVIFVLLMYGFLINQIRLLSTSQPTRTEVDSRLNELQTPRLDEEALSKIQQLQSENIEVKALFNQGRQNPFQE